MEADLFLTGIVDPGDWPELLLMPFDHIPWWRIVCRTPVTSDVVVDLLLTVIVEVTIVDGYRYGVVPHCYPVIPRPVV